MGLFDSILSNVLGGSAGAQSPLAGILGSMLGGSQPAAPGAGPGLSGLIQAFQRAGMGNVVNSWVGTGANQPVNPQDLHQVFGQQQLDQWSQQTGMSQDDLLAHLSQVLPHAVDHMTPSGAAPQPGEAAPGGESPFDAPGFDMPQR